MEEAKTKKRTMPLWVGVFCIVFGVCSLIFSVGAIVTQYQISLPVIGDIQFVESELKIESLSFSYNSTLKQYTGALVDVKNYGGDSHTGKLNIGLYTTGSVIIASGTLDTGTIASGATHSLTVPLSWQSGYTVANVTQGEIQLQQTG